MAVTDVYLRSKEKARTDLWLHPAGADSGQPPTLSGSGTVTTVVVPEGPAAISEANGIDTLAGLAGDETVADADAIRSVASLEGEDALAAFGDLAVSALLSADQALASIGDVLSVAYLAGVGRRAGDPAWVILTTTGTYHLEIDARARY